MRHLLLALMIALLPVRGWVGNAMAVDMAAQQVAMAQGMALNTEAPMPADCPMHAQAAMDETGDTNQKAGANSYCNGCNTCELCLALASFTWVDPPTSPFIPHAAPLSQGTRFSSADSVSSLKPPIS